ncbi:TIM-barrel domain-containing protein [Pseudahrensia aquimaris]|uniref:TIM-barrel domain-containing protein n=1 Tax=Pseudahrensia aquimaris TaxID=744461 RepID=A0ABW3FJK7_9HYPH
MGILHLTSDLVLDRNRLLGKLSEGFSLAIDGLETGVLRIAVVPADGLIVDRTWMIAPDGDVPLQGRDRLALDGFSCPAFEQMDGRYVCGDMAIGIEATPLRISVFQKIENAWRTVFEDRQNGAWHWFERRNKLKHFHALEPDTAHYGLGDKSGTLDRSGRRLRCLQSDALGYNAETSDPLYKHAPWLIVSHEVGSAGLLYDTMAEAVFDLGAEHSNYFERYRHVEMVERGCVLYALAGPRVRDVVPRLHRLTGMPAFASRWSMGFAFTSMHHADAPNAQEVILDFAREATARGLPLSAVHLGSGYTAGADGLRYVFNWNENRFPDRTAFFAEMKAMGLHTCANVKPVLLTGHKAFEEAAREGWFVKRDDGGPAIEMFWGGQGAQLDFTSSEATAWWSEGIKHQILGAGFDAVWNDNNEAELWDEAAWIDGFGSHLPGMESRPIHALLMMRASHAAMLEHAPNVRPYTISRAGPIGIARYGETWSGDNRTSWHTLKWNLRQGLSMSLSGFPLVGHDIGGFDGPPPDGELLVRWFQMMALHPRCVMNSWKADFDNIPNLPWMHEDVFPQIKAALELRYRFLPLIYSLAHDCHRTGHPIIAPTFYWFDDSECRADADTFMLGPNVLVAPVVEQGATSVDVYLPDCAEGWTMLDCRDGVTVGDTFKGGNTVEVAVRLDQLVIFARGGSVLPIALRWGAEPHDATKVNLFAVQSAVDGQWTSEIFIDDGLSPLGAQHSRLAVSCSWHEDKARLSVRELAQGLDRQLLTCDAEAVDWTNIPPTCRYTDA